MGHLVLEGESHRSSDQTMLPVHCQMRLLCAVSTVWLASVSAACEPQLTQCTLCEICSQNAQIFCDRIEWRGVYLPVSVASCKVYVRLLVVFLPQDTFRLVAKADTRERGGGRGGGGRVQAVRGDERGPRPILFSACTLIL